MLVLILLIFIKCLHCLGTFKKHFTRFTYFTSFVRGMLKYGSELWPVNTNRETDQSLSSLSKR